MKNFKLKIRDFEQKVKKGWEYSKFYLESIVEKLEIKFGKEKRCRMCDEKIFCEQYFEKRPDTFIKPARCSSSNSER